MTPPPIPAESTALVFSVCIPTYNRAEKLRRCLNYLLPQVVGKPVEVVVIDNASPDRTGDVVAEFLTKHPNLQYFRNSENLGYSGNQAKCVKYARGKYTAILCDDDVYAPDAVDTMLEVLSEGDYSFVALNYYSFTTNPDVVYAVSEAPELNFERADAYEVLDYPSVGHFSGMVLNSRLAKQVMPQVWSTFSREKYEHYRGIFSTVATYAIKEGNLPGYFIGRRIIGAGRPETVDYDRLGHICMDTYEHLYTMREKGVLTQQNIQRREDEILRMLPVALIRNGGFLDHAGYRATAATLRGWFEGDPRFKKASLLLFWMQFRAFRALLRLVTRLYLVLQGRAQRLHQERAT